MPAFIIWLNGLRGPEIQILHERKNANDLMEHEKLRQLAPPVELPPERAGLSLSVLAEIYRLRGPESTAT